MVAIAHNFFPLRAAGTALAEVRGTDFAGATGVPKIGMNCNFLFRSK